MESDHLAELGRNISSYLHNCNQVVERLSNDALHIDLSMEGAQGRDLGFKNTLTVLPPVQ
jgi:hypothetical protein